MVVHCQVVESGAKNIEIAVMRRGQPLQQVDEDDIKALCTALNEEKEKKAAANVGRDINDAKVGFVCCALAVGCCSCLCGAGGEGREALCR